MADDQAKPVRRWWQFRLRSLLVIMLVVAAYFGGRTPAIRRAREAEREARRQAETARAAEQEAMMHEREARRSAAMSQFLQKRATNEIIRLQATVDTTDARFRELLTKTQAGEEGSESTDETGRPDSSDSRR